MNWNKLTRNIVLSLGLAFMIFLAVSQNKKLADANLVYETKGVIFRNYRISADRHIVCEYEYLNKIYEEEDLISKGIGKKLIEGDSVWILLDPNEPDIYKINVKKSLKWKDLYGADWSAYWGLQDSDVKIPEGEILKNKY